MFGFEPTPELPDQAPTTTNLAGSGFASAGHLLSTAYLDASGLVVMAAPRIAPGRPLRDIAWMITAQPPAPALMISLIGIIVAWLPGRARRRHLWKARDGVPEGEGSTLVCDRGVISTSVAGLK